MCVCVCARERERERERERYTISLSLSLSLFLCLYFYFSRIYAHLMTYTRKTAFLNVVLDRFHTRKNTQTIHSYTHSHFDLYTHAHTFFT